VIPKAACVVFFCNP